MEDSKFAALAAVAGCALVPSGCIAVFHLAEASPRAVSWLIVAALLLSFGLLCVIPGIRFIRGLRSPADVPSQRARILAAPRATRPTASRGATAVAGQFAIFALCGTIALDIATIVSGLAGDPMWVFLAVATVACAAMSRELARPGLRGLCGRSIDSGLTADRGF